MPPTLLKKGYLKHDTELVPINYIVDVVNGMKKGSNKVMILKATTGSGKSTVLPSTLFKYHKKIVSLQPRVFNAIDIPKNIIKYDNSFVLGKNIGYLTGDFKLKTEPESLIFMTYGTFSEMLRNETDETICNNYDVIIMDEAHEFDIGLLRVYDVFKNFLVRCSSKSECPIFIITSATFDYKKFADYFNTDIIIKVKGFSFPIEEHYLKYDSNDYISETVNTILSIHKSEDYKNEQHHDILVFCFGAGDINNLKRILEKKNISPAIAIITLDSPTIREKKEDYYNIFKSAKEMNVARKIFLATNVGETGITYPYLKYVIDTGYQRQNEYNCDYDIYNFRKYPINYYSVQQRKGRVGREAPGVFYGMYSEETYKNMSRKADNQIYLKDITSELMFFVNKLDTLYTDALFKPCPFTIWRSLDKLYTLGFIAPTKEGALEKTELGVLYEKFSSMPVECFKVLMAATRIGAPILDVITLVCAIKLKAFPKNYKPTTFLLESKCKLLPVIEEFYYLDESTMPLDVITKLADARNDLIVTLAQNGFDPFSNCNNCYPNYNENYFALMKQCLLEGYRHNYLYNKGDYYLTSTGMAFPLIPNAKYRHAIYIELKFASDFGKQKKSIIGYSFLDGFVNVPQDFLDAPISSNEKPLISIEEFNKLSLTEHVPDEHNDFLVVFKKTISPFKVLKEDYYLHRFITVFPDLKGQKKELKKLVKSKDENNIMDFLKKHVKTKKTKKEKNKDFNELVNFISNKLDIVSN